MTREDKVAMFHLKHKYTVGMNLEFHNSQSAKSILLELADKLEIQAKSIKMAALGTMSVGDDRLYRSWLIIEELAESVRAMANNDEIELADGLGDLQYVLSGTAITFDIPLKAIFEEVHKSNMTKKLRCPKANPRMRDKGQEYCPPNIKQVIEKYRSIQDAKA